MPLVAKQAAFLLDVCELIHFATKQGFTVTGGELARPAEMQELYVKTGRSKTMDSQHLKRCAIDLHFFREGKLVEDRVALKPLGDYWESLNQKNRWGGNWRGLVDSGKSRFIDSPHFERQS